MGHNQFEGLFRLYAYGVEGMGDLLPAVPDGHCWVSFDGTIKDLLQTGQNKSE